LAVTADVIKRQPTCWPDQNAQNNNNAQTSKYVKWYEKEWGKSGRGWM